MNAPSGFESHAYCTYFDSHYLAQGIAMLRSLLRCDPHSSIHVLAFDSRCADILDEVLAGAIRVVRLETVHDRFPSLRGLKDSRSRWAYYATHKPAFVRFTVESNPQPDSVTFIDADAWFFAAPTPMYEEIGAASIAISPHRFTNSMQHLAPYGEYNAGCIYWRNDETGRRCLADWQHECLDWCDEQLPGDGRFMNQGYLNVWPSRYPNVHVIQHPGVNLGPWNFDSCRLSRHRRGITVDGQQLIFYHFSGLSRDAEHRWHSLYPHGGAQFEFAHKAIYGPYLRAVEKESDRLERVYGIAGVGSVRSWTPSQGGTCLQPSRKWLTIRDSASQWFGR